MDLDELTGQLELFSRVHLDDPLAAVAGLAKAPGHAGFSFLFDISTRGAIRRYFLRLPPPNVKLEGTADVLRQVCVLNALEGTPIPHALVLWSGDDPKWFGRPYFIVPRLDGDVLSREFQLRFTPEQRRRMAEEAMTGLAGVHRINWRQKCSYLGEFGGLPFDVTRWDSLAERAAEPQLLALQPRVRDLLLAHLPASPNVGVFHGDFQWANLMYSYEGKLIAIVDWELTGIGATLNDVGWVSVFNDTRPWAHKTAGEASLLPGAEELEQMYCEAWGKPIEDIDWFKALAAYKFGIITGFNLMLHRRGKRVDPHWEMMAPSMGSNMEYAVRMLGG